MAQLWCRHRGLIVNSLATMRRSRAAHTLRHQWWQMDRRVQDCQLFDSYSLGIWHSSGAKNSSVSSMKFQDSLILHVISPTHSRWLKIRAETRTVIKHSTRARHRKMSNIVKCWSFFAFPFSTPASYQRRGSLVEQCQGGRRQNKLCDSFGVQLQRRC